MEDQLYHERVFKVTIRLQVDNMVCDREIEVIGMLGQSLVFSELSTNLDNFVEYRCQPQYIPIDDVVKSRKDISSVKTRQGRKHARNE